MSDAQNEPIEPEELQLDQADPETGGTPEPLTDAQQATLFRVLRVAYPHPSFPDGPYQRTSAAVQQADSDGVLAAGLDALGDLDGLDDDAVTAKLEAVQAEPFFRLVHSTTVVALYDDHEVWQLLGYEGSSFEKGGYLHRGFDDLAWLPEVRIEEYDGEPRVEIVKGA
ncbi:hypothetical protein [Micropruina glycogenica]|uniref:Tat (Twin-arginine translocation) pathway signal sequence domain protein n=1 Tax=Micropruina glycogenica TaxID=75385 RepID=A0A2N9JEB4_9ACTN|nr:hypothetical protein [Micropruina glycogenica]SPD85734.1 Tat (Twin-arginine translocation) pathway signal sequence domain protein [Micropruina glycogenica]